MKKLLAIVTVLLVLVTAAVAVAAETTNGFTPFTDGGFVNGNYYPITSTAVGTTGIKLSGKGGLSWPDTANHPIPSAMGAIYGTKVTLNNFKFYYRIDTDMTGYTGDHWYFVSFADQARLFNAWDGADTVKCGFLMFKFNPTTSTMQIRPITRMGANTWNDFGGGDIAYTVGTVLSFEFKAVTGGYELYIDGDKMVFKNAADVDFTVIDFATPLSDGQGYIVTGAHVGNPDQSPYSDTYVYTIGIGAGPSTTNPQTGDPSMLPILLLGAAGTSSFVLLGIRRKRS